jgi:polyphosphate kinase
LHENYKMKYQYQHRDLSWLAFNYRVLQEAKDQSVPLFERLKFLAIYSSNLDEFFRVRVAQHRNLLRISNKTQKELDYSPKQILKDILNTVNTQQVEFSEIFLKQIIPNLREYNIVLKRRMDLNPLQIAFVDNYFNENLLPFTQPVLLVKNKIRMFLNTGELYLTVLMHEKDKPQTVENNEYAIIKIPSDYLNRFLELPTLSGNYELIMLDDIVRHSVKELFPGFTISDTFSIKLTRDAELYIEDEFSGDLIQKIKSSLKKRNVGPASRFVYDRSMPLSFLNFLTESFELEKTDVLPEGRYHNNSDFFKFPDFGIKYLKYKPLDPISYKQLECSDNIFDEIKKEDHFIHFPYHSYDSVVKLFEAAARDPLVTEIKVVQYRVAKKSRIMKALIAANRNGKKVTAFVEVKARFDEENNLKWGEELQEAGINVHYSIPGIKVHSKLAIIYRKEENKIRKYSYLSTGNFNEDTARIYSDFGLFTTHNEINEEIEMVFNYLETGNKTGIKFEHLMVGQFNLRNRLLELIDREIAFAKKGKKANILIKLNSIEDVEMINKLYDASCGGVKITIIVRGICCLIPGIKNLSENITCISIVDRYLEHSRIFIFENNGKEEIFLSSADMMTRNLSFRVETVYPIYSEKIKNTIKKVIEFQLNDNTKARIVEKSNKNLYVQNNNSLKIRSQIETYFYLKDANPPS